MAPSSGVLIDEAENLHVGLALDVFDLVANEMHCIHAWWSYAAEEGKGIRIRRIPSLTFIRLPSRQHHGLTYLCMHAPTATLPFHSCSTVTDLRNAELKGKGGKGGEEKGEGEGGREGRTLCQWARVITTGRRGDVLKLGHIGKVNYGG